MMMEVHVCWNAMVHEIFKVEVEDSIMGLKKVMGNLEKEYEEAEAHIYFDGEEIIIDLD